MISGKSCFLSNGFHLLSADLALRYMKEMILEMSFQGSLFLSERGAGSEIFRRAPRAGGGETHCVHMVL